MNRVDGGFIDVLGNLIPDHEASWWVHILVPNRTWLLGWLAIPGGVVPRTASSYGIYIALSPPGTVLLSPEFGPGPYNTELVNMYVSRNGVVNLPPDLDLAAELLCRWSTAAASLTIALYPRLVLQTATSTAFDMPRCLVTMARLDPETVLRLGTSIGADAALALFLRNRVDAPIRYDRLVRNGCV